MSELIHFHLLSWVWCVYLVIELKRYFTDFKSPPTCTTSLFKVKFLTALKNKNYLPCLQKWRQWQSDFGHRCLQSLLFHTFLSPTARPCFYLEDLWWFRCRSPTCWLWTHTDREVKTKTVIQFYWEEKFKRFCKSSDSICLGGHSFTNL